MIFSKRNSKLPKKYEYDMMFDMAAGQVGWSVPWAMVADMDGNCWLKNAPYYKRQQGTVAMKVTRNKDLTFSVDISGCDNQWSRVELAGDEIAVTSIKG